MIKGALLAISTVVFAGAASGETAYVTDILRLGIHEAADTSDRPFENLVSGAALEVLERTSNYSRVRTEEGREGWVKSAYLVAEKPAQTRVAELEAELARLRAAAADAQSARLNAEGEATRLGRQMAASTGSTDAVQDTLDRLKRDNASYEERLDDYRGSLPWGWVAAALGVALVAGFVGGLWWLDAAIRRRHGGFRIY
jgi:SH3 domain protein